VNCVLYFVYTRLAMHYNKVASKCVARSNYYIRQMEKYYKKLKGDVCDEQGTVKGMAETSGADGLAYCAPDKL